MGLLQPHICYLHLIGYKAFKYKKNQLISSAASAHHQRLVLQQIKHPGRRRVTVPCFLATSSTEGDDGGGVLARMFSVKLRSTILRR
jgi:hypothetical protein